MSELEKIFEILYRSNIALLGYDNDLNRDLFLSKLNLINITDYDLSDIDRISREFIIYSILCDNPYFLYIDLNVIKKLTEVFDLIIYINSFNHKSLKLIITYDLNINKFRGGRRIQYAMDFILNILGSYIVVDKSIIYHFNEKTDLTNLKNFNYIYNYEHS
jgi:hypothetical protein